IRLRRIFVIYLASLLPTRSICLPLGIGRATLSDESETDIHGIAPHRVYLISLQPNCTCFLLHLSFLGYAETTGVTRYAALWCPDFPSRLNRDDKAACICKFTVIFVWGCENSFFEFPF